MLDVSFKETEKGVYDLNVRFGQDVDPDALLKSISTFIELTKTSQPQNKPNANQAKVSKKGLPEKLTNDLDETVKDMSPVNQAVLAAAFWYQSEHGGPIAEVRDISEYGQTFREYAEFMKDKDAKQESQALRYQFRLLRENDFVSDYPNRAVTARGVEAAKRILPTLERLTNSGNEQTHTPPDHTSNDLTVEFEPSQNDDSYEHPSS